MRYAVMLYFLAALIALLTIGCARGPQGQPGIDGEPGDSIVGPPGDRGEPGQDGRDGISPTLEVIDPCGPQRADKLDEVLFRIDEGIFAYFQHGNDRRLVLLPPGTYATTDGTGWVFTVTAEGEVQ